MINPDIKPVVQSLRRIPLALRDEVSLELKRLESVVDDITQVVVQFVQKGWPLTMTDESLQPYYHVRSDLSLWSKDLKCLAKGQRVIIPQKLREVLGIAHEGHLGMVRMKQRCREVVYGGQESISKLRMG